MTPAPHPRTPLVSIIIATYNDRIHLGEAIQSALAQSYPNKEIIVVDDGSIDGTGHYVANTFGTTVAYLFKHNGGMGSARRAGLDISRGEYIQHLDSDDLLLQGKVAAHVAALEANPSDAFVWSPTICFFEGDRSKTTLYRDDLLAKSGNLLKTIIQHGNIVNTVAPLIRRSWIDQIGGWDPKYDVHDIYDVMVRLAIAGATGRFLPDCPGFLYRQRALTLYPPDDRSWRGPVRLHHGELRILYGLLETVAAREGGLFVSSLNARLAEIEFQLGRIYFKRGERADAVRAMRQSLRRCPVKGLFRVPWLLAAATLPGPALARFKHRFMTRTTPRFHQASQADPKV
jgi:hypothetical protein